MPLPGNVRFRSENDSDAADGRTSPSRVAARLQRIQRERQASIEPDELEARVLLAQKELEVRGAEGLERRHADELVRAYNAVVADGRYVGMFQKFPKEAAELVGVRLPDAAAEWLVEQGDIAAAVDFGAGRVGTPGGGTVQSPVAVVAVAVVVVVAEVTVAPNQEFVLDRSGQLKF